MLASSFTRGLRHSLSTVPKRHFSNILNSEYYTNVFRETLNSNEIRHRTIEIPNLNKETKKVELYGLPLLRPLQDITEDGLSASLKSTFNPDKNLIFLQIDPTRYLFSQRNVASKMNLPPGGSEDIQKLLQSDPIYPYTWDEPLVSLDVLVKYLAKQIEGGDTQEREEAALRMFDPNYVRENFLKKESESDENIEADSLSKMIDVVNQQVLELRPSPYFEINNMLFLSIAMDKDIILGGMPRILKRLIIGNSFALEELQEIYKACCIVLNRRKEDKFSISDLANQLCPEVFKACENIYMAILMKEIVKQTGDGFSAYIGIDNVDPIADNWGCDEFKGELEDILGIPARKESDSVDELIEKQAILDLLLEQPVWDLPYIKNPFPYLTETENTDATIVDLKKKFYVYYNKYVEIQKKVVNAPRA